MALSNQLNKLEHYNMARSYKLLSVGTNAKTIKSDNEKYTTAIIYMYPNGTICPMSGPKMASCRGPCLVNAGMSAVFPSINISRKRKTDLFQNDQKLFLERLNGTSDIRYERLIDMESYDAIFYDYTKQPNRLDRKLPKNYYLTVSYSQATERYKNIVEDAIKKHKNINVAVVFRDKEKIPLSFLSRKVIDGNVDDLRFLDPAGSIVGLYARGEEAKQDRSGFIVDVTEFIPALQVS
jgi:maltose-binding protein MalE